MVELFTDIGPARRREIEFWADWCLDELPVQKGLSLLAGYAEKNLTKPEQDFLDFYFKLKMEYRKS